jgi:hypothetical protein
MSPRGNVSIAEPAMLIRINQFYREGMSGKALYEATRGVWKVGERRNGAMIAIAVFQGLVKEVYQIESWHPAGTTPYETRSPETYNIPGRWEFVGRVADHTIKSKYVDGNVGHYFLRGDQAPVRYVNV